MGEKHWIELSIPGGQTGLLLLLTPKGQENRIGTFFNGSFGCDDVQYAYYKLLARGVELLGPPELRPFPHVYFRDRTAILFSFRAAESPEQGFQSGGRQIDVGCCLMNGRPALEDELHAPPLSEMGNSDAAWGALFRPWRTANATALIKCKPGIADLPVKRRREFS